MVWLAIGIPLAVVAIAIAVVPLVLGSIRYHNRLHARQAAGRQVRIRRRVGCPICAASIEGETEEQVVRAAKRHAWYRHGIPSNDAIQEASEDVESA